MLKQLLIFLTFFSTITSANPQLSAITDDLTTAGQEPQAKIIPFTAKYKTEWKLGWFSVDIDAKRELKKIGENRWQLVFEAETGAAKLKESSEFTLSPTKR